MSTAVKTRTTAVTVRVDRDGYGKGVVFENGPLRLPHRFMWTGTYSHAYRWLMRQHGVAHMSYTGFLATLPTEGAEPVALDMTD